MNYDIGGRIDTLTYNPANSTGTPDLGVTVPLLSNVQYFTTGAHRSWTWGNGSLYARTINANGQLLSYPLGEISQNGIQRTISYDAAGRIGSYTHVGNGVGTFSALNFNHIFGYDQLDRVTSFASVGTGQTFSYDGNGNRTNVVIGDSSFDYSTGPGNQLATTSGPLPAKNNVYDAAGNLLTDGDVIYVYSARGRMSSSKKNAKTVLYKFNGLGQRVSKSGPTTVLATGLNMYAYDEEGRLLGEYDANGVAIQETLYIGDMPIAVLKQTTSGTPAVTLTQEYYVYSDHIYTPRVITRPVDNKIVWRWDDADPFGLSVPNENPSALGQYSYNPRFPGQLFDKESNNFYNYFRDYDPKLGRYLQPDPTGLEGGLNRYSYVQGDPLSYVDPLGLWEVSVEFYAPFGGGISFGRDPNTGQGFLACKVGIGIGGGAFLDPLGGRPGGEKATAGKGGATLGISLQAGGNAGVAGLGFSGQAQGSRGYDFGAGKGYNQPSLTGSAGYEPGGRTGAFLGGSATFQGSIYDSRRK